ncbi:MAG: hypothetical protein Q6373_008310 [Candidatus Sigynarchaeota archaeon]
MKLRDFVASRVGFAPTDPRLANVPQTVEYRAVINKASGLTTIYFFVGGISTRIGEFDSIFRFTDPIVNFYKQYTYSKKLRFEAAAISFNGGEMPFSLRHLDAAGITDGYTVTGRLNLITGSFTFLAIGCPDGTSMPIQTLQKNSIELQNVRDFIENTVSAAMEKNVKVHSIVFGEKVAGGLEKGPYGSFTRFTIQKGGVSYIVEYRFKTTDFRLKDSPINKEVFKTFDDLLDAIGWK